jgi:FKBP-type peptidyl-prolyl cis-trans isomerase FkpA
MGRMLARSNRGSGTWAWIGGVLVGVVALQGCLESSPTDIPAPLPIDEVQFAAELGVDLDAMEKRPSGLWVLDEVVGEGAMADEASTLLVDFQGWLPNGTLFDTSLDSEPFSVVVQDGMVIPGFAEGLLGMRVGGERLIVVPPHLGFGTQSLQTGLGVTIPANSWLVFRIFLRDVEDPEQEENEGEG